jgi:hypothetical protein
MGYTQNQEAFNLYWTAAALRINYWANEIFHISTELKIMSQVANFILFFLEKKAQ